MKKASKPSPTSTDPRLSKVNGFLWSTSIEGILIFVPDLGARKKHGPHPLHVGRPRDLLVCNDMVMDNEYGLGFVKPDERPAAAVQRLNLLSNTMPSKTMDMPMLWRYAFLFLFFRVPGTYWLTATRARTNSRGPGQKTFSMYRNAHSRGKRSAGQYLRPLTPSPGFTAMFYSRSSDSPRARNCGFWGRRRTDLPPSDLRGDMRSRFAFSTFNGWTDMTHVWVFERVHLSPYTTLCVLCSRYHCISVMSDYARTILGTCLLESRTV